MVTTQRDKKKNNMHEYRKKLEQANQLDTNDLNKINDNIARILNATTENHKLYNRRRTDKLRNATKTFLM